MDLHLFSRMLIRATSEKTSLAWSKNSKVWIGRVIINYFVTLRRVDACCRSIEWEIYLYLQFVACYMFFLLCLRRTQFVPADHCWWLLLGPYFVVNALCPCQINHRTQERSLLQCSHTSTSNLLKMCSRPQSSSPVLKKTHGKITPGVATSNLWLDAYDPRGGVRAWRLLDMLASNDQ